RDFSTLARVVQFVRDRRPDMAPGQPVPFAAPAPAQAPLTVNKDSVAERILAVVVEKTGYPKDMLDLELDLEADLGIDTVKQAEMFASVRAAFNIPRDQDLKLRDFPTLAHVIQFARERAPKGEVKEVEAELTTPAPASFEAADAVPRRIPVSELRPPLAMC